MKKSLLVLTICFTALIISCRSEKNTTKLNTEFDTGSKIKDVNLTVSKIEDLAMLGKVWGYLKYYHPTVGKGEYNWDYELFRIMPKIIECENKNERNQIFSKIIDNLGEINPQTANKIDSSTIKLLPDLGWITDNTLLGEKLAKQLIQIRDSKRDLNYYVKLFPDVRNPIFKNEAEYWGMKFPDTGYRLLSLYRYWNIIQYFFPNKHLIGEDWNQVLIEFIPKFVNASNEKEYKYTVLELISRIHDTHANIWGKDETIERNKGVYSAPIIISFIENKAVVTSYSSKVFGLESGLEIGDIITSIDNKPVEEIVKTKLKYISASNYPTQLMIIANELLRTNNSTSKIEFVRNKVLKTKEIKTYEIYQLQIDPYIFEKNDSIYNFTNQNIGYIYMASLKNKSAADLFNDFKKTKGLIIDLRCYPSSFMVFSLGSYFMPDSIEFVKFSYGSIVHPGLFTITHTLKVGMKNSDYYKGKIVILINERTQSQAEYTTMAYRVAPKAIVIGSTTAGADGNVSEFYLPGGICTRISGLGVYYPDGRETQRVGIVPDIEIRPTIKGIKENRDELIEKAIEIINKK